MFEKMCVFIFCLDLEHDMVEWGAQELRYSDLVYTDDQEDMHYRFPSFEDSGASWKATVRRLGSSESYMLIGGHLYTPFRRICKYYTEVEEEEEEEEEEEKREESTT